MKKTAKIINGKSLAEKILLELKNKISQLDKAPGLATVLIGDDPASLSYVKNKKKACHKVGIEFHEYLCGQKNYYANITEEKILEMIDWLNKDDEVDGIIIQLPLPKKFNTQKIINQLSPNKDVDGFHPENKKKFIAGVESPIPPLIAAIQLALMYTGQNLKNKNVVAVSNNPIFAEPLIKALKKDGLKATLISSAEKNFKKITKTADILITIIGKKYLIKKSMVKPDAIIIDAGTNLIGKDKWTGDVDPKAAQVASWIAPVPGGIGPLTVAMLLKNVYQLAQRKTLK